MIELNDLSFYYGAGKPVLSYLSHRFGAERLHSVIGPSGCGKTTLLYLIAGLLKPTGGSLMLRGSAPLRGREKTAVILQNYGLFPWKTVYENMALGLRLRRIPRREMGDRIATVLYEMGLEGKEEQYSSQLSGGEKQRLAVGRALVLAPDLLLMDEPFSSLDAMTREQLQDRLLEIHASRPMTIIMITHSIEEAAYLSDRIHVMDRYGKLEATPNRTPGIGYRKTSEFFDRCVELRRMLEKQSGIAGMGSSR